jgi:H+/Cl- antiporter ClcA
VLAVLTVLKPLFTAACLGSGAPGGLFTPTLAFGVLFGGTLGHVWSLMWAGTPAGSYAVVGSAAVLAASMQGPLAATVMLVELAHSSVTLMVPLLLAVTGATVVSRLLGAQSIYSARLGEPEQVRRRHREAEDPGRPDLDGVVEQEAISAASRPAARSKHSRRSQRTQRR